MAKNEYIGVNNVARKVKQPYIGVNNVARKINSGYIGVNGIARQFFAGYVWKKYNVSQQWNYKETYNDLDKDGLVLPMEYHQINFVDNPSAANYYATIYYQNTSTYNGSFTFDTTTGKFTPDTVKTAQTVAFKPIGKIGHPSGGYIFMGLGGATYMNLYVIDVYNLGGIPYYSGESEDDDMGWRTRIFKCDPGNYGPMLIRAETSTFNTSSIHIQIFQSYQVNVQGSYITDVSSSDPNAYPINGIHSDGYWYVKQ